MKTVPTLHGPLRDKTLRQSPVGTSNVRDLLGGRESSSQLEAIELKAKGKSAVFQSRTENEWRPKEIKLTPET